jgi:hypothetical protein
MSLMWQLVAVYLAAGCIYAGYGVRWRRRLDRVERARLDYRLDRIGGYLAVSSETAWRIFLVSVILLWPISGFSA